MVSRRKFVHDMAVAGTAGALGMSRNLFAAEPPPEIRKLRLVRQPFDIACISPLWVAEDMLRAEGFEDIQYVPTTTSAATLAAGGLDFMIGDIFGALPIMDAGKPLVVLSGIHSGCFELFGVGNVRGVRDLKGKTIAVANPGRRAFVGLMVSHVGLDPNKDVTFVEAPGPKGVEMLSEGKVDALLSFSAESYEIKARKIGRSLVNTLTDKPWSQYLCCVAASNRNFITRYPVATKRVLRALLKAAAVCAAEPAQSARLLVDRGFLRDYAAAEQVLRDLPYKRWREFDPADSLRFFALRLHEAGFIKSNPQKLLAQGTDWRFVDALKREMKG